MITDSLEEVEKTWMGTPVLAPQISVQLLPKRALKMEIQTLLSSTEQLFHTST